MAEYPTQGQKPWGDQLRAWIEQKFLAVTQKGAASGVSPLGIDSKVPDANLPARLSTASLNTAYKDPLDDLRDGDDATFETRLAGLIGGPLSRFASVAALAAVRPADGTIGRTDGFWISGDGGDAIYKYAASSAAAADGATVIMPTTGSGNGRWLLVVTNRLNVKQYGAKGDGINTSGSITSGQATLTLGSGGFIGADVSKPVVVIGAGVKRTITDGAMVAGQNILTSETGAFTYADLRALISIPGVGAGGATVNTSIVSVLSATQVKVAALATTAVSGASVDITRYLKTTISSVTAGVATLAASASTTAAAQAVYYGTDDTAAINIAYGHGSGGAVRYPPSSGKYHVTALNNPNAKSSYGDNPNHTIIRAMPGSAATTMFSAPQPYEMAIHGIWFDGNGFADYCLNTDWVSAGAPSLNNSYRDLRVSGYAKIGWSAARNNDSSFDSILWDAYSDNVGLDINAPGGQVMFNMCRFFSAISGRWQSNSMVGCVIKGIRITGNDWNVLQMHGGYWYGDLTYHCNLYIAAGVSMYPGSFTGAHIENGFADGAIIGGPGLIQSALSFVGCHIFTQGAGIDVVPIVASTVGKAGPTVRIMLEGGMIEHLAAALSATANAIVSPHNTSFGGSFTNSRVEVASLTGGTTAYFEKGAIRHNEGFGNFPALLFNTQLLPTDTPTTLASMPRSGLMHVRGNGNADPSMILAYHRVGANAGVVTVLSSVPGANGGVFTIAIPSGNAQSGVVTDITISHNNGNQFVANFAVLGF